MNQEALLLSSAAGGLVSINYCSFLFCWLISSETGETSMWRVSVLAELKRFSKKSPPIFLLVFYYLFVTSVDSDIRMICHSWSSLGNGWGRIILCFIRSWGFKSGEIF